MVTMKTDQSFKIIHNSTKESNGLFQEIAVTASMADVISGLERSLVNVAEHFVQKLRNIEILSPIFPTEAN
jgi:hypothetical protein